MLFFVLRKKLEQLFICVQQNQELVMFGQCQKCDIYIFIPIQNQHGKKWTTWYLMNMMTGQRINKDTLENNNNNGHGRRNYGLDNHCNLSAFDGNLITTIQKWMKSNHLLPLFNHRLLMSPLLYCQYQVNNPQGEHHSFLCPTEKVHPTLWQC